MIYYNKNLEKLVYNLKEMPFNYGTQGEIYKINNDKCIKVYYEYSTKIEPEIFELLRDLSLPGIYKLYELLYRNKNTQEVSGYTMKYYQPEIDNILDEPIEYTLHSVDILHKTAIALSEHNILVSDRIPANVILTNDGAVMIDMDYCIKSLSQGEALDVNINNLLYMFKRLYQEGLKRKGYDINSEELNKYIESLFSFSKQPAKILERRMCGAKTPMDLFYWRY